MGKLRKDQKGFSAVETVLVLVIVGLLGFVGWYVYSSNKKANDNLKPDTSSVQFEHKNKATSTSAKSSSPVFASLPSGWIEYKSDENGLRFGYPKEWGTLNGTPLSTTDYKDDTKNIQGRVVVTVSAKDGFSVAASKYGATIKPSADGKVWIVSEENPAAVDKYKVGDTYKAKEAKVNGGTAVDLTIVDEECTLPRYLLTLKSSYAVVSIPELCPANLQNIPTANKDAYNKIITDFLTTFTLY